jgi:hypothetical protein
MMKKLHLTLFVVLISVSFVFGQSKKLELFIVKNGEPITDTLDDGTVITFETSTDDAEQENNEMDALFDDDIDAGWEGSPEDQNILIAGLRFQNINLFKGVKIDSAFLRLCSHEGKSTEEVADLEIYCEATGNSQTFDLENLITDRPATQTKMNWVVDTEWELWETYSTPDLKELVQEIVDRNDWEYGNAISFILAGKNQGPSDVDNAREWESFENISDPEDGGDGKNHPERVPKLEIYYTIESKIIEIPIVKNGEPISDTLDDGTVITFETSTDDAEQENNEMDALFDDDIDAGWEGSPEDQNILTAGLRFQNIEIAKNSIIEEAYLLLYSHEGKTAEDIADLEIVGEVSDNASTFTLDALITDRPQTTASVSWYVDTEWDLWQPYKSPNIKSIVQEIVNREGWESGNSLAIMIIGKNQGPSDVDNAREWESFENISDPEDGGDGKNHPERVPRLVVKYLDITGIFNSDKNQNTLKVYPNPANNGTINIQLKTDKPAEIIIFSVDGRLVANTFSENTQSVSLSVNNLLKGIYVLKTIQDQVIYSQKLIIK